MKRTLLVVAAGLIGLLLGIGVSLVADAVAGNELYLKGKRYLYRISE